jgi:hypothetical protein
MIFLERLIAFDKRLALNGVMARHQQAGSRQKTTKDLTKHHGLIHGS